jgi:lipoate---protein ligase
MRLLDLTLSTPAENLALDEALLEAAEAGELGCDVVRIWELPTPAVVVGRSSQVAREVDLAACHAENVPVLRRISGGAAIVAGPGCLMYSIVLSYAGRERLRLLDEMHRHVLGSLRTAIGSLIRDAEHVGTSDLAIDGRKFSGNSVRCKRDHLLYHGTLLYAFDLSLIERLLKIPPRQPDYRGGRVHGEFVTNIPVSADDLRRAIIAGFGAIDTLNDWPRQRIAALASARYRLDQWNLER